MKVCCVSFKGWGMEKTKILGKDNWQSGLRGLGTKPLKGREPTNNHLSDSEALISPWFSISRKESRTERKRGLKDGSFWFQTMFHKWGMSAVKHTDFPHRGCPLSALENSHRNPNDFKEEALGRDTMLQNKRWWSYQFIFNNSNDRKLKVSNPASIWWEGPSKARKKGKFLVNLGCAYLGGTEEMELVNNECAKKIWHTWQVFSM